MIGLNTEFRKLKSVASSPRTLVVVSKTGRTVLSEHLEDSVSQDRILEIPAGEPNFEAVRLNLGRVDSHFEEYLAIGGGSVIDFAKAIMFFESCPEKMPSLKHNQLTRSDLRSFGKTIVAVPTTVGSGAEISSSAVVGTEGRKHYIVGPGILPSDTIYLPGLLSNDPASHSPGIADILGHCIEALLSKTIGLGDKELACRAIGYIVNRPSRGNTIEAKYELQLAGRWAGHVQNNHLVSLPHAVAHAMPSLPHGVGVGISLQYFLDYLPSEDPILFNDLSNSLSSWGLSLSDITHYLKQIVFSRDWSDYLETYLNFLPNIEKESVAKDYCLRNSRLEVDGDSVQRFVSSITGGK